VDGEAEKLLLETLQHQEHVYGAKSSSVALTTYTLAEVAARQGNREKALTLLREAIDRGLEPATAQDIPKDGDLKSIRDDPRFAAIVGDARKHAAADPKTH
jgi:pentatricopeptide repeat protein